MQGIKLGGKSLLCGGLPPLGNINDVKMKTKFRFMGQESYRASN